MTQTTQTKKVILVIEDDIPLLEAVTMKLEKNGFKVISARSVESSFSKGIEEPVTGKVTMDSIERALEYLKELEQVDAVWLDHNLIGKESGLDFIIKFKANGGKWNKVPIFVVSNTSTSDLQKTYEQIGIKKYYVKAEHKLEDIVTEIKSTISL
jgi:CheY-like chemotaxis protein